MASSELSIEEIHEYFLKKGGSVANREVVKHFKRYLTDPETKEDARIKFKKYINTLATTRSEGNEKVLTLRPQYANYLHTPPLSQSSSLNSLGIPTSPVIPTSPGTPTSQYSVKDFAPSSPSSQSPRQPPPYRPPPPVASSPTVSLDNVSMCSSNVSLQDVGVPQAPPRHRSKSMIRSDSQEINNSKPEKDDVSNEDDGSHDKENIDKQPVSVKERTQKFNRLASVEDELSPRQQKERKKVQEKGADEDDGASVTSLDQKKCTEWLVTAAKGDYHELAKLASDEPRLVKLRDPFTAYTVLHWGAKHGNQEIIKLFAGKHKADVNARTNGGYTPLHIAAQMGHKEVFGLLVDVYQADPEIRDYSGRKPNQYERSQVSTTNKDTYSEYYNKPGKHVPRTKHQSFLRKNFTPSNQRRYKSTAETAVLPPLPQSPAAVVHSRFSGSYNTGTY